MVDEIFAYSVRANKLPGRFRVRIFPRKHKVVVLVSQLRKNPGMSITNAAEALATQVVQQDQRAHLNRKLRFRVGLRHFLVGIDVLV